VIPVKEAHFYITAATHPGMKGKNNEDRYAVSAHQVSADNRTPSLLAVVCDGIGGHRAGEVAAELAVETLSQMVTESDAQQPTAILDRAFMRASQVIHEHASKDTARRGMGATCVCVWVIGRRLYTASLGDSRLYFVRDHTIRQITTDHTWIQEAIESGALTPEQAVGHPNAHVIRRYLGAQTPMSPDFRLRLQPDESDEQAEANQGMRLLPGDRLVLCSDGLTDLVKKEEILTALETLDRQTALDQLIALANSRGGHDNITIVTLEVPQDEDQTLPLYLKTHLTEKHRKKNIRTCLAGVVLLALIALLGVLAWFYLSGIVFPGPASTPTAPVPTSTFPMVKPTATMTASPTRLPPSATAFTPSVTPTVTPTTSPTSTTSPTATSSPTSRTPSATWTIVSTKASLPTSIQLLTTTPSVTVSQAPPPKPPTRTATP
jgi:protein phosphatase